MFQYFFGKSSQTEREKNLQGRIKQAAKPCVKRFAGWGEEVLPDFTNLIYSTLNTWAHKKSALASAF